MHAARDVDRDRYRDRGRDSVRDRESRERRDDYRERDVYGARDRSYRGRDRDRDYDRGKDDRRRERSLSPEERGRRPRRERATGFSQRINYGATPDASAGGDHAGGQDPNGAAPTATDPVTQALILQAMLQQQPQSSKSSRELYVGNLPSGGLVNEEMLKEFLGQAMLQASLNMQPGSPIMAARLNGCYAFIEFRTVEECTNGLSLRGIVLYNNELTVDRPMAYRGPPDRLIVSWPMVMEAKIRENPALAQEAIGLRHTAMGGAGVPAPGVPGALGAAAGGAPSHQDPATKAARELHIGNLPEGTQELELRSHLEALVDASGLRDEALGPGQVVVQVRCSLKFAFAEFRSVDECSRCMMLDGALFKGQPLRVQRPRAYTGPPGPPMPFASADGNGLGLSKTLPPPPPLPHAGTALGATPAPPPLAQQAPSPALELSNMVTAGEVATDQV